jgi:hypothetical protein
MAAEQPGPDPSTEDIRPPLGSWGRLYALLIGALALEIVLLWVLGRAFG